MIETFVVVLPKWRKRKITKIAVWLFSISIGILLIFNHIIDASNWVLELLFLLLFVNMFISYYAYNHFENVSPYFKEQLIINNAFVSIANKKYPLHTISQLRFIVNEYDGMLNSHKYDNNNRFETANGCNNWISFQYGNQDITKQFYISSMGMMVALQEIFQTYYAQGTSFYEGDENGKTYLLK